MIYESGTDHDFVVQKMITHLQNSIYEPRKSRDKGEMRRDVLSIAGPYGYLLLSIGARYFEKSQCCFRKKLEFECAPVKSMVHCPFNLVLNRETFQSDIYKEGAPDMTYKANVRLQREPHTHWPSGNLRSRNLPHEAWAKFLHMLYGDSSHVAKVRGHVRRHFNLDMNFE